MLDLSHSIALWSLVESGTPLLAATIRFLSEHNIRSILLLNLVGKSTHCDALKHRVRNSWPITVALVRLDQSIHGRLNSPINIKITFT